MKISIKRLFILFAVVTSLIAVQAVWAKCPRTCNLTVEGTVTDVNTEENSVTVGETTVYGIPFAYLAKWLGIELGIGSNVVITAKQCPSTGRIMACTLSVDGSDPINLRQGSLKRPKASASSAVETGVLSVEGTNCNCDCNCFCVDETTCDCKCDCLDCSQNKYKKGKR